MTYPRASKQSQDQLPSLGNMRLAPVPDGAGWPGQDAGFIASGDVGIIVAGRGAAEFAVEIVRACNAHDELLFALKDVTRIAKAASMGVTGNHPRIARAEAAIKAAEGQL